MYDHNDLIKNSTSALQSRELVVLLNSPIDVYKHTVHVECRDKPR